MQKDLVSKLDHTLGRADDLGSALLKVLAAASEVASSRLKEDLTAKIKNLLSEGRGLKLLSILLFSFICVMAGYFVLHQFIFILITPFIGESYRDLMANVSIFILFFGLAVWMVRSLGKDMDHSSQVSSKAGEHVSN